MSGHLIGYYVSSRVSINIVYAIASNAADMSNKTSCILFPVSTLVRITLKICNKAVSCYDSSYSHLYKILKL